MRENEVTGTMQQGSTVNHNIKVGNEFFERMDQFKFLEQVEQIISAFVEKLRADWTHGMLAIVRCRIFCHPVSNPNT
jgi:hypothetical protein